MNDSETPEIACPHCGAGNDRLVMADEDLTIEFYEADFKLDVDGEVVVDNGEHLKHGDYIETRDSYLHCNDCDFETDSSKAATFVVGTQMHEWEKVAHAEV